MSAGQVFGRYRLESLLGQGGMGEVWRATDTSHGGRTVAIKVLLAGLGRDDRFAQRFRRECDLAARLTGPHIIGIHSYGEIDGRLYIEMPLVEGRDLGALVEDGPLPPERAVRIVEQVADALDTAHAAGLVHRDVKPSNVLLTPRDFAYLIDFGIARAVDGTKLSLSGAVIGTAAYMAPEQFQGRADARSDVYSLGCLLYEALVGRPPFDAPNVFAFMKAHEDTPPPALREARPELPPELDGVVTRALAKDPADRFDSAGALAVAARAALRPASGPGGVPGGVDASPSGSAGSGGSGPAAAVPAAAVPSGGVAGPRPVGGGAVAPPRFLVGHDGVPPTVVRPVGPPPPRPPGGSTARVGPPAGRPRRPGRRVVLGLLGAAVLGTVVTVGATTLTSPDPIVERTLAGHTDAVSSVAVGQLDGRSVAVSGSGDRTVRVWDLASGAPVGQPFTGHTDSVRAVAVGEFDGRPVVVSGSNDGSVRVWDLASGAPVGGPFTGHTDYVSAVAVGRLAGRPVVVSGSTDDTVRVWDLVSGAPVGEPFTGHTGNVSAVAVGEPAGRPVVVSGSWDNTVRVSDLATGAAVGQPFTGHTHIVIAVAVGELAGRPVVVSGGGDWSVRVWDLASGAPVGEPFTGHTDGVLSVAVGELDGRPVVVSGGFDRTVRVSDLATGAPIGQPLTGHIARVVAVAVAELDGRPVVVAAGADRTVRTWDLTARAGS